MGALAVSPGKSRILIVDDEESVRRLLADGLRTQGYDVTTAANGAIALEELRAGDFDAIVLDIQMSPVNGWEVIEHLKEMGSDVVSIFLSAHVDVAGTVSALRSGVFDVLQKPVGLLELSASLSAGISAKKAEHDEGDEAERCKSGGRIRVPVQVHQRGLERLIGDSEPMRRIHEQIRGFARFRDVSALVLGDTGTGKEVVALALHDLSCAGEPFVSINCAAIPHNLFESELFGHESGAFTGARTAKVGLLESAGEGTLFLDEIGEMPTHLQPKLLRVLQTRQYRRVGGKHERPFLARVVSATNRKLSAHDCDGFRSDLYFRLAGLTVHVPPLRDRRDDIEKLAVHFLSVFSSRYPGLPTRVHSGALEELQSYEWPGNVRELQTVVERAAMTAASGSIDRAGIRDALRQTTRDEPSGKAPSTACPEEGWPEEAWLGMGAAAAPSMNRGVQMSVPQRSIDQSPFDLNELQRKITVNQFLQNGRNLARTARALGIPRTTLRDRLKRYGEL